MGPVDAATDLEVPQRGSGGNTAPFYNQFEILIGTGNDDIGTTCRPAEPQVNPPESESIDWRHRMVDMLHSNSFVGLVVLAMLDIYELELGECVKWSANAKAIPPNYGPSNQGINLWVEETNMRNR